MNIMLTTGKHHQSQTIFIINPEQTIPPTPTQTIWIITQPQASYVINPVPAISTPD